MNQVSMNAPAIQVLNASAGVLERLRRAPREAGRVHSVFDRALNLEWHDGRLLALHGPVPLLAPFAAALTRLPSPASLRPGQPVWRRGDIFALDSVSIDARGAAVVDTLMPGSRTGPHAALSVLSFPPAEANGLSSGIGRRGRSRLAEGVSRQDAVAFIEGALALVGLGEGLTPAGDDCLVGALAVLHRFASSWLSAHPEISATVGQAAAVSTTTVAREFIAHGLTGCFARSLIDLLTAESTDEVRRAATHLLESGATSGADTLCGLRLALAALAPSIA